MAKNKPRKKRSKAGFSKKLKELEVLVNDKEVAEAEKEAKAIELESRSIQ